jgi:single-stranded-DNA-specific exonuclease
MEKRWTLSEADREKTTELFNLLKIHPAICKMLVQRGVDDYEMAKRYFRPQLSDLHDPWLMKDMDKATERITAALESKEKILVFGDYDVDGTTAVACMYRFLKKAGADTDYYIPHRYREGYGVSKAGIDFAATNGFTLIISLDCGIKSVDLVGYAQSVGIDFVICDHHTPDATLPPAIAILNPKQNNCPYPFKELCGCGVGFKLIMALAKLWGIPDEDCYCYLDLVATAIAADIVPIYGENRILAYFGLKQVNERPSAGIKALIELSKVQKELQINTLVFVIAPRVNAAGRMDDGRKAVQLFVEEDPVKALEFAAILHSDNDDRKEADISITEEAVAIIEADTGLTNRKSIMLYKSHWHKGVVGIVASRLIEKFYRPTVVLTASNDIVAGSARSVSGFNIYEAIHQCRDLLIGYGGHFYAAGVTLETKNVPAFRERFEAVVANSITKEMMVPEIVIDAEVRFKDLKHSFYKILQQMEPYGPENMRPVFIAKGVKETGYSRIVKEQHIRFVLQQDNITFTGIAFNMAAKYNLLQPGKGIDIVFTLDENDWNGEIVLQLKVIDFRISE